METCDVLIAGGGPAGSTCAWALRQAGLDVVVMDRATFPRDKVCAGWITPQVLTDLRLDVHGYRHGRTFQPFTGFRIPAHASCRWKGHAYLLSGPPRRRVDDGVVLVGDAAGLAHPQRGEGIRPAIESGLIAASTIIEARSQYTHSALARYEDRLRERFAISRRRSSFVSQTLFPQVGRIFGPWLLRTPWFVRHVLLNRWFQHAREPALALA